MPEPKQPEPDKGLIVSPPKELQPAIKEAVEQRRDENRLNLPTGVKSTVDEAIKDYMGLIKDYADINRKAEAGEKISGQDFLDAEKRFNEKTGYTKLSAIGVFDQSELVDKAYAFITGKQRQKVSPEMMRYFGDSYSKAMDADPELRRASFNEAIDRAFVNQRIANAPKENTSIPADVQTEQGLVDTLLANNRGIAVADIHTKADSLAFVTRNMAEFRKQGVDTLYMEQQDSFFERVHHMTDQELRIAIEHNKNPAVLAKNKESTAKIYNQKIENVDDVKTAYYEMALAARENGVRLINIDKKGIARDMELTGNRLANTNFVWTDTVEADRKALKEQTGKDGKFILFGGAFHLTSTAMTFGDDKTARMVSNGFVDEGLGIPTIGFEKAKSDQTAAFRKSENANGIDFYLPAKGDYPALHFAPEWFNPISELQKPAEKWQSPKEKKSAPMEKNNLPHDMPEQLIPGKTPKQMPKNKDDVRGIG